MSGLEYSKPLRTIIVRGSARMWGKNKENGVWMAVVSDWRWRWRGHDALYIAAGRYRLRLMKPWRS